MNTYLETFQNISQSVEQLLTDDHNSLEIKQSATKFRESVQPCIEELKHSATRLKNLVQGCFDDLHHAEDVWNAFYNYFLERQERYRQETPEQRQAEKAWIDQQRRELTRVQYGIEAILNQSAG